MNILNQEVQAFIDAAYPIVYIHTEATMLTFQAVNQFANQDRLDLFDMSKDDNLSNFLASYIDGSKSLDGVFIVLKEVHQLLNDAKVTAQLRQIGQEVLYNDSVDARIIIIAPLLEIPRELEKITAIFSDEELKPQVRKNFIRRLAFIYDEVLDTTDLDLLNNTLEDLSLGEVNMVLNMLIQKNGSLSKLDYEVEIANIKKYFASQIL